MEHIKIFGHTIEFRGSGTGSLDPWSADYAHASYSIPGYSSV